MTPHSMTLMPVFMPVVGPPPAMSVVMPQQPSQQFVYSFAPPPLPIVAAQQQYMGIYDSTKMAPPIYYHYTAKAVRRSLSSTD
jgi:hypothetical protein